MYSRLHAAVSPCVLEYRVLELAFQYAMLCHKSKAAGQGIKLMSRHSR